VRRVNVRCGIDECDETVATIYDTGPTWMVVLPDRRTVRRTKALVRVHLECPRHGELAVTTRTLELSAGRWFQHHRHATAFPTYGWQR
jgi:hypothetical protein